MDMNMDQYIMSVAQRYDTLPEEQKDSVRAFRNTEIGQTISYILGPELGQLIGDLREPMPIPSSMPAEPAMPVEDTAPVMNKGGFLLKAAEQPKPQPKRNRGIAARKKK